MSETAPLENNGDEPLQQIAVRTFGGLSIYYEGKPITIVWESQKARVLFCFLLISFDQWVHRDILIELLWPGCDKESGAKNFKTTLSRLRKSFAGPRTLNPVIGQGDAVRLNSASISCDASLFKSHAANGLKLLARGDTAAAQKSLEAAQDLYLGEFLPEEPFIEFISNERKELAWLYKSVIISLQKVYEMEGNLEAVQALGSLKKMFSSLQLV